MTNQNACLNMIKQQLRTGDVLEESILKLYDHLPRSAFVPTAMKGVAYSDMQIPLPHGQQMMTPLEEGKIIQALALRGHETVLEVGTGSGFLTALLSRLSKNVISIEYYQDLAQSALTKLRQFNCNNVEVIIADGARGWLELAPFHVVIISAAVEQITDTHRLQVLPGGKLIMFVGRAPVVNCILLSLDHQNNWTEESLFETYLPPLISTSKSTEFVF